MQDSRTSNFIAVGVAVMIKSRIKLHCTIISPFPFQNYVRLNIHSYLIYPWLEKGSFERQELIKYLARNLYWWLSVTFIRAREQNKMASAWPQQSFYIGLTRIFNYYFTSYLLDCPGSTNRQRTTNVLLYFWGIFSRNNNINCIIDFSHNQL